MKRLATFLLVGLIASTAFADEPPSTKAVEETGEDSTTFWMEKKMEYSQALLRGLALGDFEDIKFNASRLGLLNRVEGFIRSRNPTYRAHVNTFQRSADEIFRQAERKNLEGSTLAFNSLTVSCVKCHQSLRDHDAVSQEVTDPAPKPKKSE